MENAVHALTAPTHLGATLVPVLYLYVGDGFNCSGILARKIHINTGSKFKTAAAAILKLVKRQQLGH